MKTYFENIKIMKSRMSSLPVKMFLPMAFVLLFLAKATASSGTIEQEPDLTNKTITWHCTSTTDNGTQVSASSSLVSSPTQVHWIQSGLEQTMTVLSHTVNWENGQGTIEYIVGDGSYSGSVTINSQGSQIVIDINLTASGSNFSYALTVDHYTY